MTLADLERIVEEARALGAAPDLLMLRHDTAVAIVGHYNLTPLADFAKAHRLRLVLSDKVLTGEVYVTEEHWRD